MTKTQGLFPVSPQQAAHPVLPILQGGWLQVTEEDSARCRDGVQNMTFLRLRHTRQEVDAVTSVAMFTVPSWTVLTLLPREDSGC